MTRLLPLVAIVLSLGALAFAAMPRDADFIPPPPSGPSVDEQARAAALEQRVINLENQNRAVWERVQSLEAARGAPVAAAPVNVAPVVAAPPLPDAVKAAVDQVLADREHERVERRQRDFEERSREADIRWNAFINKAQLSMDQANALNRRLEAERAAREQANGDPEALGRSVRSLREAQRRTDEELMPMLTEPQRQQYQQVRREERRRPEVRKN